MDTTTYAAVRQIKPGQYAGQVRNIFAGALAECGHKHKSRSAAMKCGEKLEVSAA